jgi:hypothetical protein
MHDGRRNDRLEGLGKLLRHPLRQHLLFKYAESVTSPSDVADALEEKLNLVSYHTNVLLRAGCLELVRTERRRGAREHFYRAVLTSEIHDADWEQLPVRLRRALARLTIDATFREVGDALPRGGMDGASAHVSRSFLMLDREGRDALASLLRATIADAFAIERASRDRGADDEVPFELIVMSFERASRP